MQRDKRLAKIESLEYNKWYTYNGIKWYKNKQGISAYLKMS